MRRCRRMSWSSVVERWRWERVEAGGREVPDGAEEAAVLRIWSCNGDLRRRAPTPISSLRRTQVFSQGRLHRHLHLSTCGYSSTLVVTILLPPLPWFRSSRRRE